MKANKKKAISASFNWIFVLIVGAILVIFFLRVVGSQKEKARLELETEMRSKLQSIASIGQSNKDATYGIRIPEVPLEFSCDGLVVGTNSLNPIKLSPGFAPDRIIGKRNKIFVFSADFSMPFYAGNAEYIIPADMRFVIINDSASSGWASQIYNDPREVSLPDNATKEAVSSCSELRFRKAPLTRIVFFDGYADIQQCALKLASLGDKEVTAVRIRVAEGGLGGVGVLTFYRKQGNAFVETGETAYIGRAMLMGGVVSTNHKTYNCGLKRALDRLSIVAEVQARRVAMLWNRHSSDSCGNYYDSAKVEAVGNNAGPISLAGLTSLYRAARELENSNRLLELKKESNCPLMY